MSASPSIVPSTPVLASMVVPDLDAFALLDTMPQAFPTLYPVHDRFETELEAVISCQAAAKEDGYALTSPRTKKDKYGVRCKRFMACNRGGDHISKKTADGGLRHIYDQDWVRVWAHNRTAWQASVPVLGGSCQAW